MLQNSKFGKSPIQWIILLIAVVALGLSIASMVKPCNDGFGNGEVLNLNECKGAPDELECAKRIYELKYNINAQFSAQPANRMVTYSGGAVSGAFGNSDVLQGRHV